MTLNAHYDGKVFVPDEPLDLPAGTRVRIGSIEPIGASAGRTDFSKWIGLANRLPIAPHDPGKDEDILWEKGYLPGHDSR